MALLSIHKDKISIPPSGILPMLGTPQEELDSFTESLIMEYTDRCRSVMEPRGGYARFEVVIPSSGEEIEIQGHRFSTGKVVRNMLRDADEFALFVTTAGPGPEKLAKDLIKQGMYLEGLIADTVASVIVESAANQVEEHIKDLAASAGKKITNRYSPGYCAWDVSEQQKLFALLPEGFCGITLSETSLMSPIKSVSGIIGIGSEVVYNDYTCEICPMKECVFRKTVEEKSGTV